MGEQTAHVNHLAGREISSQERLHQFRKAGRCSAQFRIATKIAAFRTAQLLAGRNSVHYCGCQARSPHSANSELQRGPTDRPSLAFEMPNPSVPRLLLLLAVTASYFSASDAHSKQTCCVDKLFGSPSRNFTCEKPTPYCCRSYRRVPSPLYCCSDCSMSVDKDDCDNESDNYESNWKYIGYAIGCLVLLLLLAGLIFGLVKLFKTCCCKRRSTIVRSAAASSSASYPRNIESVPEWQQPPKKPPEYYDIFTVSPPPAYKERPDSA